MYVYFIYLIDMATRIRTLERGSRSLKSERSHLQEEISSLKENLATKSKELKDSKTAYREAQDEIATVSEK